MTTKYLLTAALPYANGSIHLGHLLEHVQADIYVRALRARGDDAIFLCADDTHGTPIELNARQQGITPEALIERSYEEHARDFVDFSVDFDLYYTTNSPENQALAELIFERLRDGGHIERKTTLQFYSENLGRFLPDRMVRGTCPRCGATEQYGDACEVCRSTYDPSELIDPIDAIEGATPVLRESEQLYVRLADFTDVLTEWASHGIHQEGVQNFVSSWMDRGLDSWCISRDAPYFGFPIPGEPGKYFYVWLDAPVGYISTTQKYLAERGEDWRTYWAPDADAYIIHIIGKDIVYFHTLFWPAMLHAASLKKPDRVQVHGFLTVNGTKMSKSRGTFIRARTYLDHLDPDYLRFYYASRLGPGMDDLDLSVSDFVARVNSDLINNPVNLCSRVTKLLTKRFEGKPVPFDPADFPVCAQVAERLADVVPSLIAWDYRAAIRAIAEAGDIANLYLQEAAPWKVVNDDADAAQRICSVGLHLSVLLMHALHPIVPRTSARFAAALGLDVLTDAHCSPSWQPEEVAAATLLARLDVSTFEAIIEASRAEHVGT